MVVPNEAVAHLLIVASVTEGEALGYEAAIKRVEEAQGSLQAEAANCESSANWLKLAENFLVLLRGYKERKEDIGDARMMCLSQLMSFNSGEELTPAEQILQTLDKIDQTTTAFLNALKDSSTKE